MNVAAVEVTSTKDQVTRVCARASRGGFSAPKVGRTVLGQPKVRRLGTDASPYPQASKPTERPAVSGEYQATHYEMDPRQRPLSNFKSQISNPPPAPRRLAFASKFLIAFALFGMIGLARNSAADTKPPARAPASPVVSGGPSFETFRPVAEQNIFNPNRVGRSARAARTPVAAPTGDSIRFVGTMEYEKGYFAFFDSPNAKFRGVLSQGGVLADFTIKRVTANKVELAHGDQTLSLQVAQELKRAEGADWTVSAAPTPTEVVAVAASEASPTFSPTDTPPAIPTDASDTLKRLMEQRQKQLKE